MTAADEIADARDTVAVWRQRGLSPEDVAPLLRCAPDRLAIETNIALRLMRRGAVPLRAEAA